jgi:hypothetical protein
MEVFADDKFFAQGVLLSGRGDGGRVVRLEADERSVVKAFRLLRWLMAPGATSVLMPGKAGAVAARFVLRISTCIGILLTGDSV